MFEREIAPRDDHASTSPRLTCRGMRVLHTLAVEIVPGLRQPVASIYNAFRFSGYALAPPLLGLVYGPGRVGAVYLACGLAALGAAGLLALLQPRRRQDHSRTG